MSNTSIAASAICLFFNTLIAVGLGWAVLSPASTQRNVQLYD
jgi:hypothetical protein